MIVLERIKFLGGLEKIFFTFSLEEKKVMVFFRHCYIMEYIVINILKLFLG